MFALFFVCCERVCFFSRSAPPETWPLLEIVCRGRAKLIGTGNFEAISPRIHASVLRCTMAGFLCAIEMPDCLLSSGFVVPPFHSTRLGEGTATAAKPFGCLNSCVYAAAIGLWVGGLSVACSLPCVMLVERVVGGAIINVRLGLLG